GSIAGIPSVAGRFRRRPGVPAPAGRREGSDDGPETCGARHGGRAPAPSRRTAARRGRRPHPHRRARRPARERDPGRGISLTSGPRGEYTDYRPALLVMPGEGFNLAHKKGAWTEGGEQAPREGDA